MNITHLRSLVAIADNQSFAAAAERLYLTPAAVSQQMKALEHGLEVALFDRTTRPPRLSPHGQLVAERAREVLVGFDTLVDMARAPGEISGRMILGCVSGVSSDLIPLALANLRERHPGLQIRIEEGLSGALANRVRRRELDAALITELPVPDPELDALAIVDEPLVVVAPPDTAPATWQQILSAHPFIRLNRNAGMGTIIDTTLRTAGVAVREAMELDSSETIVGMVKAKLGAGVVPAGRLKHESPGAVTVVPFGTPPARRRIVLTERVNNQRSNLSRVLYAELKHLTE
ncbi:MAG: LysR family transcriptional regulator [Pirellulales bacterium]|nr:LysR family transcriptional regulator [Pirellulales bacterium]